MKQSILLGDIKDEFIVNESLSDIFKNTVKTYPNKLAVVFNEKKITYKELDQWSDEIASSLIKDGINIGDCIGLWYHRSIELHVAVLAITKAGATYIPIDVDMPIDRVENIYNDISFKAIFTEKQITLNCKIYKVTEFKNKENPILPQKPKPSNFAYILYTSGSTGKPKGIPITHRQICHLIRSEQSIINISKDDKVYQGFSISFDMWCEETWISYFVGATLYVADSETSKAIDELSFFLKEKGISVLHAVPSLLGIMGTDIPTLRLVNAGGEACSKQVVSKWATSEREFYNSYGPTETTVTSSMVKLKPNDEISIGLPLPNYHYAIVDENLNILPIGHFGELVITGVGVGNGYINLPELTTEKFVKNKNLQTDFPGETIYRSGDAALMKEDNTIEFHGRIDDQIKLRGYRIELGEIENQISIIEDVLTAAVTIKKDSFNQDQLVGYIIIKDNVELNETYIQKRLLNVLPSYMIPQLILVLDEMPRLPSGKVNRKLLPTPESFQIKQDDLNDFSIDEDKGVEEKVILILRKIFPDKIVSVTSDFFTDLNGHSMLAATFVSMLRKGGGMKNISLKDVYMNRPILKLIDEWDKKQIDKKPTKNIFIETNWLRHALCGIAQTISLIFVYGLFASQIYLPYLGYYYIQTEFGSHINAILTALSLFCFIPLLLSLLSILIKWVVIGKYKEGVYPLWGTYFFRWWFVEKIERLVQINFLNGTPIYGSYLRLRGVKIGNDSQISAFNITAEDLVEIGDDVSISSNVNFSNVEIKNGTITFSKIIIGNHAYIGSACVIEGNTVIEDWGELKDLSCLNEGKTIKSNEIWEGSPAELIKTKSISELQLPLETKKIKKLVYYIIFSLLLFIFPFALLTPLLPVLILITELDNNANDYDFSYFIYMPLLSLIYIVLFSIQTIILTRLLQQNIKSGKYPIYSFTFLRKWLSDQLISLSLLVLHQIFATVYISTLFRLLGAKIGKYTEISTANNVSHTFLEIGSNSFIADNVTLGETDVRGQQLIIENTLIGSNSFVGNSALISQGYVLNDDMLIGVLSLPPNEEQTKIHKSKDWFGSPSIPLPRRQGSGDYDQSLTFRPTKLIWAARAIVELIRCILPETILLCCSTLFIAFIHDILIDYSWWEFIIYFPFYFLFFIGLPTLVFTLLLKWIFIGKYKPKHMPMWSKGVWFSEAITSIYESLAVPFFLEFTRGTPWLPFFMRLFGSKIGKKVYMDTTDITEFDMVELGDCVSLNEASGPQTHLFEDRVMKIGKIKIGSYSSVGTASIILYDTEIGENVNIGSLSLLMKGETLEKNTNWSGCPVKSN